MMLFLLYRINDCFESFRIVDGEFGKDFTIDVDPFFLHSGNELGVRKSEFARSVVDAGNPKSAKVAFTVPAVAISVAEGFNNSLFCEAETTSSVMLHTLSSG